MEKIPGSGSGRSVEIYNRVFSGIFFTLGYFWVFLGISGYIGYHLFFLEEVSQMGVFLFNLDRLEEHERGALSPGSDDSFTADVCQSQCQ